MRRLRSLLRPGRKTAPGPLGAEEIDLAFRLLLGRPPKPETRARLLQEGTSPEALRAMLMRSPEFQQVLARYRPDLAVPAGAAADPVLIHIHIPKTAGTSLNALLLPLFPRDRRITGTGHDCETALRAMPPLQRARIGLVVGHITHAIGALMPGPVRYLAILRDPGPRILSYYKYVKFKEDHPLYPRVQGAGLDFGGFLEMAASMPHVRAELEGGQMRRIAGDITPGGFGREQSLFETACRNLTAPDMLYGFTENFDLFQDRLVAEGILPAARRIQQNVSPPGPGFDAARAALSPAQGTLLGAFIAWDEKFLAFARGADTPARAG